MKLSPFFLIFNHLINDDGKNFCAENIMNKHLKQRMTDHVKAAKEDKKKMQEITPTTLTRITSQDELEIKEQEDK